MHRSLPVLALLAALAGVAPATAAPQAGDAAPDFVGRTFEGEPLMLPALAGKVVVVSFWASWCGPCRKELPLLERIQMVAGKERLQVVAVNIEDLATYRRIVRAMAGAQLTLASDTAKEAQQAYGVKGIPHTVIVDKTGRIVRVHRGYSEAGVDDVVRDLNRALAP